MPDHIITLDDYRPGWDTAIEWCPACGHRFAGVLAPGCSKTRLECPRCHKMTAIVLVSRTELLALMDDTP